MKDNQFQSLYFLILGVSLVIISNLTEGWIKYANMVLSLGCLFFSFIKGSKYLELK